MNWFRRLVAGSEVKAETPRSPTAVLEYYRNLGFFVGLSTEEVLVLFREEWGRDAKAETPWDDVLLLRFDTHRTWVGDPEADVCPENQVYVEVLSQWAMLTGGDLNTDGVEEIWESDVGPIDIKLQHRGDTYHITPNYNDDWIDLNVLPQLNRLLGSRRGRFNCAVDGNFCLVTYLPLEVEQRLNEERRFPFMLSS